MGLEHFRPLLVSHDLVQDLRWDSALRQELAGDLAAVLDRYELLPAERRAIEERDFKTLYHLGLHPYLLSQLARLLYGTIEGAGSSEAALALVRSLKGDPSWSP